MVPTLVDTFAFCSIGMLSSIKGKSLFMSLSMVKGWAMSVPMTGKCNEEETSSKVMVISSTGWWMEDVFSCHLSTKAFTKPLFVAVYHAF